MAQLRDVAAKMSARERARYKALIARVKLWRDRVKHAGKNILVHIILMAAFLFATGVWVATGQYVIDVFQVRDYMLTMWWTVIVVASGGTAWWSYKQLRKRGSDDAKNKS